jgi:transposase-like protein
VALEAMKETKTIQQIARENDLHPVQVSEWKKALQERVFLVFETDRPQLQPDFDQERQGLHSKIGELTIQVDYLQKKYRQLGLKSTSPS